MIYYLITIAVLTFIFWSLHKARIIPVCPICAGVVITWVGGAVGLYYEVTWANSLIIAILMGVSLGALADKYGSRLGLLWKSAMVLLGLPAIYFIVQKLSWQGAILVAMLVIITIFSHKQSAPAMRKEKDLFKDCC